MKSIARAMTVAQPSPANSRRLPLQITPAASCPFSAKTLAPPPSSSPVAMTLLAAITNPSTTPAAGVSPHPLVCTPGAPPPPPEASSGLPTPIPPSTWSLAPADPTLATAASFLTSSISSCSSVQPFRVQLYTFLSALAQFLSQPAPPQNIPEVIRVLAPYFPVGISPVVASAAARLADYEVVLALAQSRLLTHPPPGVISSLSESDRPDYVCAVLRHAADLRSSEILAALRCFLSPASEKAYDAMVEVKSRWRAAAVSTVNSLLSKTATSDAQVMDGTVRRAALLLMMGHDGFSSPEVCLHYLLASDNVDSVVLGSAVAELDGEEVVRLVRYLNKWMEKYRRFPEAQPCPEAALSLPLALCDSVPTFGAVARALGVVLDNHFSHLVLNADVREDLRAADVMLKELAAEAESSGPILDLIHRLQQDK